MNHKFLMSITIAFFVSFSASFASEDCWEDAPNPSRKILSFYEWEFSLRLQAFTEQNSHKSPKEIQIDFFEEELRKERETLKEHKKTLEDLQKTHEEYDYLWGIVHNKDNDLRKYINIEILSNSHAENMSDRIYLNDLIQELEERKRGLKESLEALIPEPLIPEPLS